MTSRRRVVFEGEMHAVPATTSTSAGPFRAPTASEIEGVREIGKQFPSANLRPVSLVRADGLDLRADPSGKTRIWLAVESLQTTGSFKVRGALLAMSRLPPGAFVVAASAGNHGIGVSCAARITGARAVVCVPGATPETKKAKIAQYGAELVMVPGDRYDDAEAHAKALAEREGATFLSPYDDHDVVLGNGGSLGLEIVEALGGVPDVVLAPFGGGGLATGLAWAMAHEEGIAAGTVRRVWGVQSEASPAMALSLGDGFACVDLDSDETVAEGLEGGVSTTGYARAAGSVAGVVVVREALIGAAMLHAEDSLGLTLEGSAAVALVPAMVGLPQELRGGDVVCVLTGRNVDQSRLDKLRSRY